MMNIDLFVSSSINHHHPSQMEGGRWRRWRAISSTCWGGRWWWTLWGWWCSCPSQINLVGIADVIRWPGWLCRDLVGTWTSSSTLFLSAAAPLSSITLTSEKVTNLSFWIGQNLIYLLFPVLFGGQWQSSKWIVAVSTLSELCTKIYIQSL